MALNPRSTAKFISYDLRPAKQTERLILLDTLKIAGDCGMPISKYRYIGMGANLFYDFLLIHKYLGLNNMVSLEHNSTMFKRAEFNCPYQFINVRDESSATFMAQDHYKESSIMWFDYDGGIGQDIFNDIATFGTNLKLNDFCFVTVCGEPPRAVDNVSDKERLDWIQDFFGTLSVNVTITDVERSNFPNAVYKMLIAAFKNAFSVRKDGNFLPFLQILYKDSMTMITVGGALLEDEMFAKLKKKINTAMPFIMGTHPKLYKIKSLHITEKERTLFDRVATTSDARFVADRNHIKRLGFKTAEISAYKELLRYLPRYVETIV